jgi:hypothetical protein
VGPLAFKSQDAPRYGPGFVVVVITAIIAGLLILVYRFLCMWDNNRRDKAGILEGYDHAYEDDSTDMKVRLTWRHASRYCNFSNLDKSFRILNSDIFYKYL